MTLLATGQISCQTGDLVNGGGAEEGETTGRDPGYCEERACPEDKSGSNRRIAGSGTGRLFSQLFGGAGKRLENVSTGKNINDFKLKMAERVGFEPSPPLISIGKL